jgi:hypothetical protein
MSDDAMRRLRSERFEPIMACGWRRSLFIHFEVDPTALQAAVPLPLELFEGRAYLTVAAIHVECLRSHLFPRVGEMLMKPLAIHRLLNVRTYVRWRGEGGICLLTQWLQSRINLILGPLTYGLPYRAGFLRYNHDTPKLAGQVIDQDSSDRFAYEASITGPEHLPASGSLAEFLLERYTAYTFGGRPRFYRIWHEPWPYEEAAIEITDMRLLANRWPFLDGLRSVAAHYSRGVPDVWLGRPHFLPQPQVRSAFLKWP